MIQPVSFKGIEDSIKSSNLVKNSKADAARIVKIIEKSEKGEAPVKETLEFMEDKLSDKKRNALIAVGSFIGAVVAYKTLGAKVMPYIKQAGKFAISLLPDETGKTVSTKISKAINKELKDIKPLTNVAGELSKVKVKKVGDVAEWGLATVAAALTSKGANEVGDMIDDAVDMKKI